MSWRNGAHTLLHLHFHKWTFYVDNRVVGRGDLDVYYFSILTVILCSSEVRIGKNDLSSGVVELVSCRGDSNNKATQAEDRSRELHLEVLEESQWD